MGERRAEDGWIEWDGDNGLGPVPPETEVVVRVRDGYEHQSMTAGFWAGDGSRAESNWLRSGEDYDIIAYRVVTA
ncbi:hypothetical protein EVB67_052 [Rhizobium phage RHph_TM3_3_14B]|nr:hypothetical protein EVB67_052 [Rhizobium phage RHph_TM3_3_14B]